MKANWFPALIFFITLVVITTDSIGTYRSRLAIHKKLAATAAPQAAPWRGWGKYQIPDYNKQGELIRYGYDLITNTSHYLGPFLPSVTLWFNTKTLLLYSQIILSIPALSFPW